MEQGKIIKTFTTKKGNSAVIRYPEWNDLDDLLSFANALSKEDTFVLLSGEEIPRNDEVTYLANLFAGAERGTAIPLVATVNGAFAANCGIDVQQRRKRHVGTIHISVAKPFREEGLGRELLKTLIAEAKAAGLKLLTLTCLENNPRALHVYESTGFIRCGLIPKAIRYHESYVGEVLLYLQIA